MIYTATKEIYRPNGCGRV